MTKPVQITFRNMRTSASLEDHVRARVAWLERFHPDLVGCRVLLEVPHPRRLRDGLPEAIVESHLCEADRGAVQHSDADRRRLYLQTYQETCLRANQGPTHGWRVGVQCGLDASHGKNGYPLYRSPYQLPSQDWRSRWSGSEQTHGCSDRQPNAGNHIQAPLESCRSPKRRFVASQSGFLGVHNRRWSLTGRCPVRCRPPPPC